METADQNSNIKMDKFRRLKIVQLIIIGILDIFYLCLLIFNKPFRSIIFGNIYVCLICLIAWLALIVSLVFILIDLKILKR